MSNKIMATSSTTGEVRFCLVTLLSFTKVIIDVTKPYFVVLLELGLISCCLVHNMF